MADAHSDLIRDQFTRQATPFSTAAPIADAGALKMIVDAAQAGPADTVLDLACGGGIVVCAFAPHVRHATGIDMTPAMLAKARASAAAAHMKNVEFRDGFGEALPVEDEWADVVISNGVLNLMPDKAAALQEMARVLKPGGRLQIGDILVQKPVPQSAKEDIALWTG